MKMYIFTFTFIVTTIQNWKKLVPLFGFEERGLDAQVS